MERHNSGFWFLTEKLDLSLGAFARDGRSLDAGYKVLLA